MKTPDDHAGLLTETIMAIINSHIVIPTPEYNKMYSALYKCLFNDYVIMGHMINEKRQEDFLSGLHMHHDIDSRLLRREYLEGNWDIPPPGPQKQFITTRGKSECFPSNRSGKSNWLREIWESFPEIQHNLPKFPKDSGYMSKTVLFDELSGSCVENTQIMREKDVTADEMLQWYILQHSWKYAQLKKGYPYET